MSLHRSRGNACSRFTVAIDLKPSHVGSPGFTLLEILVVLVIIGIMASFAVLQFGGRGHKAATTEAARLTALVRLARDEAILDNRDYGLGFSDTGYAFYSPNDKGDLWTPVENDRVLRSRSLPEPLRIQLTVEDQLVELKPSLPKDKPQVFLYSSGEMTPFTIHFHGDSVDSEPVTLSFDALGRQPEPPQ